MLLKVCGPICERTISKGLDAGMAKHLPVPASFLDSIESP